MNNQRRHQLEQNVLASYLGNGLARFQPLLKPAAIAALVAGLGFLAYTIYESVTTKNSSEAWTKFYFNLNGDADSFSELAEEFRNSPAGQWSRHSAATGYLRNGIEALYTNRPEGVEAIQKAIAEFETVKDSRIVELRNQSLYGLAQAHESLGELDKATAYCQQLLDSTVLSDAERDQIADRLNYLKSPGAEEFYDWFTKLDPKPIAPPIVSGDLSSPPTSPTISFDPAELPQLPNSGIESPITTEAIPSTPPPANESVDGDPNSGDDLDDAVSTTDNDDATVEP